ncbi:MAG: O-antigen ligase family protein [Polaribacter sp.]
MIKSLENFTKFAFLALATFPLLLPNHNSMIIILCSILSIYYFFKLQNKPKFNSKILLLTIPFFLFLLYEIISNSFNSARILRQLPFLIFPFLFFYRPSFINNKIKTKSFYVFQIATIIQSLIYLFLFIKNNSIKDIFNISNANIPFFREYVQNNYLFEIHPTYFSSFLLVSFTMSLFWFFKAKILNTFNILICVFFLFLFSSRVIIIILILSLVAFLIQLIFKNKKNYKVYALVFISLVTLVFSLFNSSVVRERFKELKTEIKKPIVGDYYNSTNTRIAIYKCDFILLKSLPIFGYGNTLQQKLNLCYKENNDSDFYTISVFNTHNYYFNLILYGGFLFFIVFLIYFVVIFIKLKHSLLALFIFFQFLTINLTENFLSRHYGIVLFSYFTALFFIKEKNTNATTKHI